MKMRIHNASPIAVSPAKHPALILALMLWAASPADAQAPTQSLGELQARLRTGQKIVVIDSDQKKIEGRFDGVSLGSLGLITNGARREFQEANIREVRTRRPESRWDGALIGLGIGAVAGLVTIRTHCRGASERDDCLAIGMAIIWPVFAAAGAGSGALIDFAIKKHDTVFAPASEAGYRLRVSPVLDRHRRGVALALSF